MFLSFFFFSFLLLFFFFPFFPFFLSFLLFFLFLLFCLFLLDLFLLMLQICINLLITIIRFICFSVPLSFSSGKRSELFHAWFDREETRAFISATFERFRKQKLSIEDETTTHRNTDEVLCNVSIIDFYLTYFFCFRDR